MKESLEATLKDVELTKESSPVTRTIFSRCKDNPSPLLGQFVPRKRGNLFPLLPAPTAFVNSISSDDGHLAGV